MPKFVIRPALSPDDIAAVRALFGAYAAALDVDLSYQDFASELAALPGKYALPTGALLLARAENGDPLGCVALRAMAMAGSCEMKRLYVAPQARGLGLGRALVEAIAAAARATGYRDMRLDTLPSMADAQRLYLALGFEETTPYYDTPVAGTRFLRLALTR